MNPLHDLTACGQSVWLDYIERTFVTGGSLARMIRDDGLRGLTSNPAIFERAMTGGDAYDDAIRRGVAEGMPPGQLYEAMALEDIRNAADRLRDTYDRLEGSDGFVSLEVSPHLARDTNGTLREARRLWAAVDRPNCLIKVPGTLAGLPAIRQLISDGINVNVTLLFGLPRYQAVARAYLEGLEARAARQQPIARVASVASFFLSRIDVMVDPDARTRLERPGTGRSGRRPARRDRHREREGGVPGRTRMRSAAPASRSWPNAGRVRSGSSGRAPAPSVPPTAT